MTERSDAVSAYAEQSAAIAEELAKEAVSRLIASAMDLPESYPLRVGWVPCNIGVLIETEHGSHAIAQDALIRPADILQRLIHPGFGDWHRTGGGAHWC